MGARHVATTLALISLVCGAPRPCEAAREDEAAAARAARATKVAEERGDQGEHERSLTRDLLLLERRGDAVRLVLDGRIRIWGWPWHVERELVLSDSFQRADHHASSVITVTGIDEEGLHLRADSRFVWDGELKSEDSESFCLPYSEPWQVAAHEGDQETLRTTLGKGKRADPRDGEGRTPLLLAVYRGHGEAVLGLLERGADVNAMSAGDNGVTALMLAARYQPRLVGDLLAAGADPDLLNPNGDGPLFVGIRDPDGVRALFDAGVRLDSEGTHKAFGWAVREGPIETIQQFIDRGVDVNARIYGRSILEGASGIHGKRSEPGLQDRVVQMLIEAGATE